MRSPVDHFSARFARGLFTVILATGLGGCSVVGGGSQAPAVASLPVADTVNGPRADYPVVVGAPYEVQGTLYTPIDTLNYDEVGYATVQTGAMGYSAAHHTLPFPSYVEVTSLETGRTVLVRLEARGPMDSTHVVALSPAAMAQLGAGPDEAVRVRRVNPPEEQRAMLRAGNAAPLRIDTPASLLTVLQRRLPDSGSASLRTADAADEISAPVPVQGTIETVEIAASDAAEPTGPVVAETAPSLPTLAPIESETSEDAAAQVADATPEPAAPVPTAEGRFHVQAASFASQDNARRAAAALGGQITESGRFYRVRTGPFVTRGEAEASLAKVRRAGYSDARIQTSG